MEDWEFVTKELSAELGREVEDQLRQGKYGDSVRLLASVDSPDRNMLYLLAFCTYMHGLTVLLDKIVPQCQKALEYLDQAEALGEDPSLLTELRMQIHKTLREEEEEEKDEFDRVHDEAYRLANECKDHKGAARLFDELARLAQNRDPRYVFFFRYYAATERYKAGDVAAALPIIEQATEFDWWTAGLPYEWHTSESAFRLLLEHYANANDISSVRQVMARAVARGEQLGRPFPYMLAPEIILDFCIEHGLRDYCEIFANQIEQKHEEKGPDLKKSLAAVKRLLST